MNMLSYEDMVRGKRLAGQMQRMALPPQASVVKRGGKSPLAVAVEKATSPLEPYTRPLRGVLDRVLPSTSGTGPEHEHGEPRWSSTGAVEETPGMVGWQIASLISGGMGAYHGYKRHNGSISWALGWSFLGGVFPVFVPAIALAQGFGKPLKKGK
jgi:hypothetical protein